MTYIDYSLDGLHVNNEHDYELETGKGEELDEIGADVDLLRFVESDNSFRDRISSGKCNALYLRLGIITREERDTWQREMLKGALENALEPLT